MLEDGYAAVSYRSLATKAGVTPAVVQYYFPTLDSLLLATIRRRTDRHVERLLKSFAERPDEPLRVIWEFSKEEAVSGLMVEFTALANHRKSIQAEIAKVADSIRQVQIEAINTTPALLAHASVGELSKPTLVFFLAGIPRLLSMDARLGATLEHPEIIRTFEHWLDTVEPRSTKTTGEKP